MLQKDDERDEHIGFIRKVLGIVAAQMLVTFSMSLAASFDDKIGRLVKNPFVYLSSIMLLMTCFCILMCSSHVRKSVPQNYFWLFGFTLGESVMIAAIASELKTESVVTSIMATCVLTACLFFAALNTSTSVHSTTLIRNLALGVVGALILTLVFNLIFIFTWAYGVMDRWMIVVYSCLVCVISGIYIIFALLMLIIPGMTDKDDYILGALRLYIEIARLFMYVLIILGDKK